MHLDGRSVRIAVEVLEVQARLNNPALLVGVAFLPRPISILLENDAGLLLDEITDPV